MRKLFQGGNYSRAETIWGNTVSKKVKTKHAADCRVLCLGNWPKRSNALVAQCEMNILVQVINNSFYCKTGHSIHQGKVYKINLILAEQYCQNSRNLSRQLPVKKIFMGLMHTFLLNPKKCISFRTGVLKFHPYFILAGDTMVRFVIFCVLRISDLAQS